MGGSAELSPARMTWKSAIWPAKQQFGLCLLLLQSLLLADDFAALLPAADLLPS